MILWRPLLRELKQYFGLRAHVKAAVERARCFDVPVETF